MFKIQLDFQTRLRGCPDNGIPAIDFRRSHGLPEAPTSECRIKFDGTSEWVCRELAEYTNSSGDLVFRTGVSGHNIISDYGNGCFALNSAIGRSSSTGSGYNGTTINPHLAKVFLRPDAEIVGGHVLMLLRSMIAEAGEIAAARDAEAAKRDAEAAQRRAESDAKEAVRKAEKDAAIAAGKAKLAEWCRSHGSETAKLRLEEGLESWVSAAKADYAESIFAELGEVAVTPDGYTYDDSNTKLSPAADEIKALRAVRSKAESLHPGAVTELLQVKYTCDDEAITRTEISVTLDVFGLAEMNREFLIG